MRLFVTSFALLLTACNFTARESVQDFLARNGGAVRGSVTSLPYTPEPTRVDYDAAQLRDPFIPIAAPAHPAHPYVRRGHTLEAYALDALRMVGTVRLGNAIFALVRAPDGVVYQVKPGDGVGQDFGVVLEVADDRLTIVEKVIDSSEPAERSVVIRLSGPAV